MFSFLKRTKKEKNRETQTERLEPEIETAIEPVTTAKEKSSIVFHIDDDLSVSITANISEEAVKSMIKNEYLNEVEAESKEVVEIATIVYLSDILDGIIQNINGN